MTLDDLYTKVKAIPVGTNFLMHDFLQAVNSNFCCRTQRFGGLATIRNATDDRRTQHCSISATVSTLAEIERRLTASGWHCSIPETTERQGQWIAGANRRK